MHIHRVKPLPGFTIVELLVSMGVIVLLLSLLTVAIGKATKAAQRANTTALMNSMKQALTRFKSDFGYYPPVLGPEEGGNGVGGIGINRALVHAPDPEANNGADYPDEIQEWFSVTTLAEYLIGYGTGKEDGYGYLDEDEIPTLGIRDPSPDGVWGGSVDRDGNNVLDILDRNLHAPKRSGQRFGPYIELKDDRLIAATDGELDSTGRLNVYFPGERSTVANLEFSAMPKVIVDYWGRPIRYYRQVYPEGSIRAIYRNTEDPSAEVPTLADVWVLRPFDLEEGSVIDGIADRNGSINDTSTTRALKSADLALFSPGPDKRFNADMRLDLPEEFNRDNIVELGP